MWDNPPLASTWSRSAQAIGASFPPPTLFSYLHPKIAQIHAALPDAVLMILCCKDKQVCLRSTDLHYHAEYLARAEKCFSLNTLSQGVKVRPVGFATLGQRVICCCLLDASWSMFWIHRIFQALCCNHSPPSQASPTPQKPSGTDSAYLCSTAPSSMPDQAAASQCCKVLAETFPSWVNWMEKLPVKAFPKSYESQAHSNVRIHHISNCIWQIGLPCSLQAATVK